MRWYVGSDHGAVELRERLAQWLRSHGHEVGEIFGPASAEQSCDYPEIAEAVGRRLAAEPGTMGLLVCGTGQGMAMSANRIRGVRAALVTDAFSAVMAREHNDANAICMGQRVLGPGLAEHLLSTFANASFEGGRHARRVGKIEAIAAAPPDPTPTS